MQLRSVPPKERSWGLFVCRLETMHEQTWAVYLIRDENESLYTGITTDVPRRFREHVEGGARSAKYTRSKKRLELVYVCAIGDRSLASKVEYRLKRLNKTEKEAIIRREEHVGELLDRLGLVEK